MTADRRQASAGGALLLATISTVAAGQDPIVVGEGLGPLRQVSSLETECDGSRIRVEIVNRSHKPSFLSVVTVNGSELDIATGKFEDLANFVARSHNAFLVDSSCGPPGQVSLTVQALQWQPSPAPRTIC